MKEPKIISIEWYDAHSSDKWQSIVEAKLNMSEMMLCNTIGYEISRTKNFIVVAHTLAWQDDDTPTTCGVLHIPMKCIKTIGYL